MREILFKAKTAIIVGTYNCGKDDGEWVIGHLWCDVGRWMIRQFEYDRADYVSYEVDPESVCQYTGLTDKNGKKIWENDICKRVLLPTKRITNIFRISYIPVKCCFSAIDLDGSNVMFISDYINSNYEVEVIGNIFDNQELLKKE